LVNASDVELLHWRGEVSATNMPSTWILEPASAAMRPLILDKRAFTRAIFAEERVDFVGAELEFDASKSENASAAIREVILRKFSAKPERADRTMDKTSLRNRL
jgi:hypothetical protein